MNKICTSIEQSKRLIELGIDIYTADMFWKNGVSDKYIQCFTPFVGSDTNMDYDYDIPAWSLTALLKLMPFHIIENNNRFGFYQGKGFNKQGETYRFGYKTNNDSFLFETSLHNDVVEAAFEMIVWLKENGKI